MWKNQAIKEKLGKIEVEMTRQQALFLGSYIRV
jgi:hypothetical protein